MPGHTARRQVPRGGRTDAISRVRAHHGNWQGLKVANMVRAKIKDPSLCPSRRFSFGGPRLYIYSGQYVVIRPPHQTDTMKTERVDRVLSDRPFLAAFHRVETLCTTKTKP